MEGGFKIGRALYEQSLFFCNPETLYNHRDQVMIKAIQFSKQTATPIYKNLNETPAKFIDKYFIIEGEIKEAINGNK